MSITPTTNWATFNGGDEVCTLTASAIPPTMDCQGLKSVTLTASGGIVPYSWETTNGVLSGITGSSVTLTPDANPGSGVAGVSYIQKAFQCSSCTGEGVCFNANAYNHTDRGCNDEDLTGCVPSSHLVHSCSGVTPDPSAMDCNGASATCLPACSDGCAGIVTSWDCRDAAMIAAGCNPCQVSFGLGAVITVTDAVGQSAIVSVEALSE